VPSAGPGDPDALQHGLELGAVPALARGDQHRQRLLVLLAGQVHLGGQPAPRPSQAVIVRLVTGAAGRFGLQVPLFRAPAACLCARATVESTDTSQVISPAASARPCKAVRIFRQVPSRCQRRNSPYTECQGPYRAGTSRHGAGADPPPDPVDQLPPGVLPPPARLLAARQQRLQHRPLRIGQVGTAGHGYGRHEVSAVLMGFLGRCPIYRRLHCFASPSLVRKQYLSTTKHF